MKLKSSFSPIEALGPKFLQEDTLFPPKSWHLSLHRLFRRWRSSSLRAMRMKREYWPQWMRAKENILDFPNESSWTLKTEQLLGGAPNKNKDFYTFTTLVVFV